MKIPSTKIFSPILTCVCEWENQNDCHNLWDCHHKTVFQYHGWRCVQNQTKNVCSSGRVFSDYIEMLRERCERMWGLLGAYYQLSLTPILHTNHPTILPAIWSSECGWWDERGTVLTLLLCVLQTFLFCNGKYWNVWHGCQEIEIFRWSPIIWQQGRIGWSAEVAVVSSSGGNIWQRPLDMLIIIPQTQRFSRTRILSHWKNTFKYR